MRILIVGADSNYAIEKPYIKYLSQIEGISKVIFFSAQNQFLNYYHKGLLQKLIYRSGLSNILNEINNELIKFITEAKPDIIFVFKGMELFPSTLKWAKEQGIKLANYNPDNPFLFSGRGSGNSNITKSIKLYDLHFTYDSDTKNRIETEFGIRCFILPFGFDLQQELFETCEREEEVQKVCFLGNPDRQRASFINAIVKNKFSIDVYGHGWVNFIQDNNVRAFDGVYGNTFWKTLRKYRIQLNLMRVHNPRSHNMRTFEVPAVGGIQLAPDTIDHRTYFESGKEIFLYNDLSTCLEQIESLISMPTGEAGSVRKAARARSLDSGYSYECRALQLFSELKILCG